MQATWLMSRVCHLWPCHGFLGFDKNNFCDIIKDNCFHSWASIETLLWWNVNTKGDGMEIDQEIWFNKNKINFRKENIKRKPSDRREYEAE